MPEYIVSLAKGLSEQEYAAAEKHAVDQGGKITTKFDRTGVAPGFVVDFPKDSVSTLESGPHVVAVEDNGTVKTQ